jgi:GST-like protein
MIDFYALTSPNVQKIFIMLEECALPYKTHLVDVWKGEQFTPEFTRINPLQKIPAIVDSDGPAGTPYTVIESGAILIYLAEKTGKFIPHDPVKRYDSIHWLMVQMANVGPMCGQLVHFSKYAPAGEDYGNKRYRTQVNKLFDLYEQRLAAQPYVACSDYTIADIAAFPWLRNVGLLAIDLGKRPHVKA